jgi:hypothetical protein
MKHALIIANSTGGGKRENEFFFNPAILANFPQRWFTIWGLARRGGDSLCQIEQFLRSFHWSF